MNKKAKRISIIVTISLLFSLLIFPPFIMALFANFPSLDKTPFIVLELVLQPDTKYSSDYTDEKFALISIGMTEKQVLDIIGEPLTRWRPYLHSNFQDKKHFVGLQYSESPSGGHYNLRQIYLDNGIVSEIISYFYID